jgi:hypothetical protein
VPRDNTTGPVQHYQAGSALRPQRRAAAGGTVGPAPSVTDAAPVTGSGWQRVTVTRSPAAPVTVNQLGKADRRVLVGPIGIIYNFVLFFPIDDAAWHSRQTYTHIHATKITHS